LDSKAESELLKVLQKACKTKTKESLLIVYNILKYLSFVETLGNREQVRRVIDGLKLNQKYEQAAIDDQQRLKADVSSNIVLQNYPEVRFSEFLHLMDLQNMG